MNYQCIESPFGRLLIVSDGQALKRLAFIDSDEFMAEADWLKVSDPVIDLTVKQLEEWFSGQRQAFDLPLAPEGTEFQKQAWRELQNIPYGSTWTYGEQALRMNKPSASRAVGAANGRNPIALVIPCHRVIGANGKLTGYAGGIDLKEKLLKFEAR